MSQSQDIPGTASKDPLKLCPCARGKYLALVDAARDAGIRLALVETLRDAERQRYYVKIGTSWTLRSKHLPQPPNGLALAFDACPHDYLAMKGWNPGGPAWRVLADLAEAAGLRAGANRTKRKDRPHYYQDACSC